MQRSTASTWKRQEVAQNGQSMMRLMWDTNQNIFLLFFVFLFFPSPSSSSPPPSVLYTVQFFQLHWSIYIFLRIFWISCPVVYVRFLLLSVCPEWLVALNISSYYYLALQPFMSLCQPMSSLPTILVLCFLPPICHLKCWDLAAHHPTT